MAVVEFRLKRSWVWDPLFIEAISKWKFAFTVESEISFPIRFHIWCLRLTSRNFVGNLAVISSEASFEASVCAKILGY
ncbi:hypothetical protein H5410_046187 [Solanum commersonii]|uniref:Uncharacterized protein n=1 Tax=Solanum commersonii TaxID=4109 RepID=A0A9J5XBK9_SOLCO|nr:hypothetical protein H5410_046187 [Solanum commersonii]